MKAPNGRARIRIQESINSALRHIIVGHGDARQCFSVSVLDFVLRAAFTLDREDESTAQTKDIQEVSDTVLKEANIAKDPLKLLGDDDTGGKSSKKGSKKVDDHAAEAADMAAGMLMEEDLMTPRGLAVIYTHKQVKRTQQAAEREKNEATEQSDERESHGVGVTAQLAKERLMRHARLVRRVDTMFSPAPYRRGLPLERLQLMLLALQHIPREELIHWLDIFEEQWAIEKRKNAMELRHVAMLFKDYNDQDDIDDPNDDVDLRLLAQQEQDKKLAEPVDDSRLPLEMKWVRLAMRLGGGFSLFKLNTMIPVAQRHNNKHKDKLEKKLEEIRQDHEKVKEHASRLQRHEVDAKTLATDAEVKALLAKPEHSADEFKS